MTSLLPQSLWLLLKLQTRAAFRRVVRSAKTPKGAIFATIGFIVFLAWLGPALFNAAMMPHSDPQKVRLVAPLVFLALCVATLVGGGGDKAISFTAGEINFLFPGPFTRRDLLFYKLARTFAGGVFAGAILSLVLMTHSTGWVCAFVGGVLAMWMVQLLAVAVLMAGQAIGERVYSRGRKLVLVLIGAAIVVAVAPRVRTIMDGGPEQIWSTLEAMLRSPAARIVFAPFEPFVRTFTAGSAAELLGWGAAGLAIDLLLLGVIVRLDADYREAALAASQRVFEMAQRVQRGQLTQIGGRTGALRRTRIRMFPWLGGAGPTAWRQLVTAMRASRASLFILALLMLSMAPLLVAGKRDFTPAFIAVGWITMFLSMMVKFDFRSELDQMEWIKAMPLHPTAIAAGQLAVPVLVLSSAQCLLLGVAAALAPPEKRMLLLTAIAFSLPFNLILLATDNLLFLLFPSRSKGAAPGDIGQLGRGIVFFLFKILIILTACAIAGLLGLIAGFLAGKSTTVGIGVGYVILCAIAVLMVPLVGIAYRRFDPSNDTPA